MLAIGVIGAATISIISLSLYGKIYLYNGYAYTGWLWTLCFILITIGSIILSNCKYIKIFAYLFSIAICIVFGFVFSDKLILYIISMFICIGSGIFFAIVFKSKQFIKILLISIIIGIIFASLAPDKKITNIRNPYYNHTYSQIE